MAIVPLLARFSLTSKASNISDNFSNISDNFDDKLENISQKITYKDILKFIVSIPLGYFIAATVINSITLTTKKDDFIKNSIIIFALTFIIIGGILIIKDGYKGWGLVFASGFILMNYGKLYFSYSNKILAIVFHLISAIILEIFIFKF
jgi:hypothetical protein